MQNPEFKGRIMAWADLGLMPQGDLVVQVVMRLLIAALLGGSIGIERELNGKAAGLRTQMLVCVGTAFILIAARLGGIPLAEMSKVIQGILPGIGFIGGGVILKLSQDRQIKGLTTAATIWTTAAIGIAAGLGPVWLAIVGTVAVWIILIIVGFIEKRVWSGDRDNV